MNYLKDNFSIIKNWGLATFKPTNYNILLLLVISVLMQSYLSYYIGNILSGAQSDIIVTIVILGIQVLSMIFVPMGALLIFKANAENPLFLKNYLSFFHIFRRFSYMFYIFIGTLFAMFVATLFLKVAEGHAVYIVEDFSNKGFELNNFTMIDYENYKNLLKSTDMNAYNLVTNKEMQLLIMIGLYVLFLGLFFIGTFVSLAKNLYLPDEKLFKTYKFGLIKMLKSLIALIVFTVGYFALFIIKESVENIIVFITVKAFIVYILLSFIFVLTEEHSVHNKVAKDNSYDLEME